MSGGRACVVAALGATLLGCAPSRQTSQSEPPAASAPVASATTSIERASSGSRPPPSPAPPASLEPAQVGPAPSATAAELSGRTERWVDQNWGCLKPPPEVANGLDDFRIVAMASAHDGP